MSLTNLQFIFVLFPLLLLFVDKFPFKSRTLYISLYSLILYFSTDLNSGIFLMLMILFSYFVTKMLDFKNVKLKKLILWSSITLIIGSLVFSKKYFGLSNNFITPIGLSYFTFKSVSLIVDKYKQQNLKITLLGATCYISLFTEITSGPITLYSDFNSTLEQQNKPNFEVGLFNISKGIFKYSVLSIGLLKIYSSINGIPYDNKGLLIIILQVIVFSLQIYLDFSGYTDIARGINYLLGFTPTKNFNYPYHSNSVTEFWSKWHISLTSWFRNYVYFPLGGNRKGAPRTYVNILIIFILSGIWHGTSKNFMAWGLMNGLVMVIERMGFGNFLKTLPTILQKIYFGIYLFLSWFIFSTINAIDIMRFTKGDFGVSYYNFGELIPPSKIVLILLSIIFIVYEYKIDVFVKNSSKSHLIMLLMILISMFFLISSGFSQSIYTKF